MTIIRTKTPTGEKIVMMSEAEFERLCEAAEDARDAASLAKSIAKDGLVPDDLLTWEDVDALRAAPSPLHFWRRKRALMQSALAKQVAVSQNFLSDIENGRRLGDVHLYARLAKALKLDMEDLVPAEK